MTKLTRGILTARGFTQDRIDSTSYYKTFMGYADAFMLTYDVGDETMFVGDIATNINHVEELDDLIKLLTL